MFSRFKAGGRQRQQQRFLIFEEQRLPAAFFFLERCFVVFPEPSFDCLVQLRQRKELLISLGGDPCPLLFIDKGFDEGILAISHNTDKNPGSGDLTSIRINDFRRISSPIYLDLLPRFSRDMHGGAALLLILLDVIAELGIHEESGIRLVDFGDVSFANICRSSSASVRDPSNGQDRDSSLALC